MISYFPAGYNLQKAAVLFTNEHILYAVFSSEQSPDASYRNPAGLYTYTYTYTYTQWKLRWFAVFENQRAADRPFPAAQNAKKAPARKPRRRFLYMDS